jgi:hypothetical protein
MELFSLYIDLSWAITYRRRPFFNKNAKNIFNQKHLKIVKIFCCCWDAGMARIDKTTGKGRPRDELIQSFVMYALL